MFPGHGALSLPSPGHSPCQGYLIFVAVGFRSTLVTCSTGSTSAGMPGVSGASQLLVEEIVPCMFDIGNRLTCSGIAFAQFIQLSFSDTDQKSEEVRYLKHVSVRE